MDWLYGLIFGEGIAHSIFVLALVIAVGLLLGRIRIGGISIGITWILFVGIAAAHFGVRPDSQVLEFAKDFGLILFIYSIGIQAGPGFFASFKKGGLQLVGYAVIIVFLGVVTTLGLGWLTGTPLPTMVGVMSGAVNDTPGLGAAQQAYQDVTGTSDPTIAMGYAVAYPLGVLGGIFVVLLLKWIFRVRYDEETVRLEQQNRDENQTVKMSVELTNANLYGKSVSAVKKLLDRSFVISRICRSNRQVEIASADSVLAEGDTLFVVCEECDKEAIVAFLGREERGMLEKEWYNIDSQYVSRRILITKPGINGKTLGSLRLRNNFEVNVSRVNRAGVDLVAVPELELQMGDKLTVVGREASIAAVANLLGNSMRRLREPNLVAIFIGILLGVVLGSVPIALPGIPMPVRLGLAGGPLIVALLLSRFGPHYKLVTYTTLSANLMLRQLGISIFLAGVGLSSGEGFVETIVGGGYWWVIYGFIITLLPSLIVGMAVRRFAKMNFFTLSGMLAGVATNPIALAFINSLGGNDRASVTYSTVYPFAVFLRVVVAQSLILFLL